MFNNFKKEIHQNNVKVGWWNEVPENRDIELNAVRLNFMHLVLSRELENVRRGNSIDINNIHLKIDEIMKMDLSEFEVFLLSKISLMHSELSEATEYLIKNEPDKHLPNYDGLSVELSDLFIRLLDFCEHNNIDILAVAKEKFEYNKKRTDHKQKEREKQGGKKI